MPNFGFSGLRNVDNFRTGMVSGMSSVFLSDCLRPHGLYTVHGILQARILEWVAIPFSRGSFRPRNQTGIFCTAGGFFNS